MSANIPNEPILGPNGQVSPAWRAFFNELLVEPEDGAPTEAQYLTLAADAGLSAERILTAGTGISLTDNGAGNTLVVAASDADWEVIASGTVSNAASLDLTDLSADARAYKLVFDSYVPATDNTDLYIRVSTDNGSSFASGNQYAWMAMGSDGSSVSATNDTTDTEIEINIPAGGGFGNAANTEYGSGEITVNNPMNSGSRTNFTWIVAANGSAATNPGFIAMGRGERTAQQAHNAFQIFSSSGNIDEMEYTLYQLRAA